MFNYFKKWANPNRHQKTRHGIAAVLVLYFIHGTGISAHANDVPYEGKMLRIAEVLGSLHFLRNLCGEKSLIWRERMDELIAKEKPAEAERLRLISNFNRGYRGYSDTYSRCTPSAKAAIDSYLKEGAQLSNELVSRYGH